MSDEESIVEEEKEEAPPPQWYYAASTGGFYRSDLHAVIPQDAQPITEEEWRAFLAGQGEGRLISAGKDGRPVLLDRPPPTPEELARAAATRRDTIIRNNHGRAVYGPNAEAWHDYLLAVGKVDANNPVWPVEPKD